MHCILSKHKSASDQNVYHKHVKPNLSFQTEAAKNTSAMCPLLHTSAHIHRPVAHRLTGQRDREPFQTDQTNDGSLGSVNKPMISRRQSEISISQFYNLQKLGKTDERCQT